MKKPKLDDYELFYMELPQTDYLNEIEKSTRQDKNIAPPTFDHNPTMSAKQVKELALDQLRSLELPPKQDDSDQKSLFSKPVPQD